MCIRGVLRPIKTQCCKIYRLNVIFLHSGAFFFKCLDLAGLGIGAVSVSENTPQAGSEANAGAAESPTGSGTK